MSIQSNCFDILAQRIDKREYPKPSVMIGSPWAIISFFVGEAFGIQVKPWDNPVQPQYHLVKNLPEAPTDPSHLFRMTSDPDSFN